MYTATDANYHTEILDTSLDKVFRLSGTIYYGATSVTFDETDVVGGSFIFTESSSSVDKIEIGCTFASGIELSLFNMAGEFDAVTFADAQIEVSVGYQLDDASWEDIPLGRFLVIQMSKSSDTIQLKCLDKMVLFERPFSDVTGITYPATLQTILAAICTFTGVTLATTTFLNGTYSVAAAPSDANMTIRQAVAYIAQVAASNARFSRDDELELYWYDTDLVSLYTLTADHRSSLRDNEDELVITGLSYNDGENTTLWGTDALYLALTKNPFLQSSYTTALGNVASVVIGFHYTPFESNVLFNDPARQAGDCLTIQRKDLTSVVTYITSHVLKYSGGTELKAIGSTEIAGNFVGALTQEVTRLSNQTLQNAISVATAQTTADGKNTVYYSATMPTGGTYKANDIWFDTDNSNKMYLHDGSAWVAVQFGENAIADLAITDAKIANATISNAKIANLDAGKITTGTLNAARIAASSITFDKLASAAVTSINDEMDIGGRNYIPNSDLTADYTGWAVWNANTVLSLSSGLRVNGGSASIGIGTAFGVQSPVFDIEAKEYTLSLEVSSYSRTTSLDYMYIIYSDGLGNFILPAVSVDGTTSDYKFRSIKFTAPRACVDVRILFAKGRKDALAGEGFRIRKVKLEVGNKYTDWTPAPEDKADTADLGDLAYEDLVESAKLGSTVIEGGLIKSDLLTADNVVTGKLQSVDGKAWFDLDTPEIVQTATIDGKDTRVEMSPDNPFKLTIDDKDYIYVTDTSGFSGPNILVTSKYDVNEDGRVDEEDLNMVFKYVLHQDIETGTAWPAGYPLDRMDVNGDGLINSYDLSLIFANATLSNKLTTPTGEQIILNSSGLTYSDDWGETSEAIPDIRKRTTSSSSGSSSTAWVKIAAITMDARYEYATVQINVIGSAGSAGQAHGASIMLSLIQQSDLGSNPVGGVSLSNAVGLSTSSVKAVITQADATASIVELYVQAVVAYKRISTRIINNMGNAGISYTLGSWTASLPAGTQLTTTLID